MSYITLKCKNCGGNMTLNTESHSATCNHCGSTFLLADILDEKDMAFSERFTPKNIEKKMMAQTAFKQGETYLFQGDFEKAELSFKRVIELDEDNYKGYLGVVKAKTQNLNQIPENDDYLQYAHYALSLAQGDDLVVVKSELAKIELLKHEKNRQKKAKIAKEKQEIKLQKQKKGIIRISSIITVCILVLFGLFILLNSTFSNWIFGKKGHRSIDIDSYETLEKVFTNKKYLSYDINLTADIDCNNTTLSPLGTSSKAYSGNFNGNNHTISNLTIKPTSENYSYSGFFGHLQLAKVSNLVLDKVCLEVPTTNENTSSVYCGILAGKVDASSITNIEIKNTCSLGFENEISYDTYIGGLAGYVINSSVISSISSHATITSVISQKTSPKNVYIGGIAGVLYNSVIHSTCSSSSISSTITNTSYSKSNAYISGTVGKIFTNSSKTLLEFNKNFFSGAMFVNANVSTTDSYIAAIANSNTKSSAKHSNYCLYSSDSFKLNNSSIDYNDFKDYEHQQTFMEIIEDNGDYISKLTPIFSTWKNSTLFTPSLV